MARTVAIVLVKTVQDVEATSPKEHLESLGMTVTPIGIDSSVIEGKKGETLSPDLTLAELTPAVEPSFDALIAPGGGSAATSLIKRSSWTTI